MKCRHCGRGLTYHRAEENPPVMVIREDMTQWLTLENGDRIRPQIEFVYCGVCYQLDRHEHEPRDLYFIALGDSDSTAHWEVLSMEVAA